MDKHTENITTLEPRLALRWVELIELAAANPEWSERARQLGNRLAARAWSPEIGIAA